jgi:hypothetical protein
MTFPFSPTGPPRRRGRWMPRPGRQTPDCVPIRSSSASGGGARRADAGALAPRRTGLDLLGSVVFSEKCLNLAGIPRSSPRWAHARSRSGDVGMTPGGLSRSPGVMNRLECRKLGERRLAASVPAREEGLQRQSALDGSLTMTEEAKGEAAPATRRIDHEYSKSLAAFLAQPGVSLLITTRASWCWPPRPLTVVNSSCPTAA